MVRDPPIHTASKAEMDDYFSARNRELTRRAMERDRKPSAEPLMKPKPVEYVEMFNSDVIEKDYGTHRMSYEKGRGFLKKAAGLSSWGPASPEEIRIFKNDVKAAAAQNPGGKIARHIAHAPDFG